MFDKSFRRRIADLSTADLNPPSQIGREGLDEVNDPSRVLMCHAILNVDELMALRVYSNQNPQSELLVEQFEG